MLVALTVAVEVDGYHPQTVDDTISRLWGWGKNAEQGQTPPPLSPFQPTACLQSRSHSPAGDITPRQEVLLEEQRMEGVEVKTLSSSPTTTTCVCGLGVLADPPLGSVLGVEA